MTSQRKHLLIYKQMTQVLKHTTVILLEDVEGLNLQVANINQLQTFNVACNIKVVTNKSAKKLSQDTLELQRDMSK